MNMIESAKEQVRQLTQDAYRACVAAGTLPGGIETHTHIRRHRLHLLCCRFRLRPCHCGGHRSHHAAHHACPRL